VAAPIKGQKTKKTKYIMRSLSLTSTFY